MAFVSLFSNDSNELEKFLSSFYNTNFELNKSLNWTHKYMNPIELAEIIGVFIDNIDKYKIFMFISLDKGIYLQVTEENSNDLIKYIYERFPY